ncbi:unnamed protein product [Meganyctiphanes norvegica]|uniref:Uncharacterized protein n=1 Tax=Meganyctiphanes norvegica TaxID=48144 RepID=A0AAV2PPJ0_MEGNR
MAASWILYGHRTTTFIIIIAQMLHICKGQLSAPNILESPTDVLVALNEPATLNCHATGWPRPNITWFKDDRPFSPGSHHVLLDTGDLFFLRTLQTIEVNDAGVYWCIASNAMGQVISKNATLEIADMGTEFLSSPFSSHAAVGDTVLLTCTPPVGHPKPVVSWQKDGQPLPLWEGEPGTARYRVVDDGNLVITDVRLNDAGEYVCLARNQLAERRTDPAMLTVLVPPHIKSSSSIVNAKEGKTAELECLVDGSPHPEVFWHRINHSGELPLGRMELLDRSQVLRIQHLEPNDQGVYACTADNPAGQIQINITLNVKSAPQITVTPINARVRFNERVSFKCETSGSPTPYSYWRHEMTGMILSNVRPDNESNRITVDNLNTLTINKVRTQDQGYYVCSAVGVAGSAFNRVHLEVLEKGDMPPPIIAFGSPNQTLPLGTEAEMHCEARGTPEPKVTWERDGRLIRPNERTFIDRFGTLKISNLKISDTDVYKCTAESNTGSTTWISSLTVAKPTNPNIAFFKMPDKEALPEAPGHVSILGVNSTVVMLGWQHGTLGSSSLLGYTVQMWSPDRLGLWTITQTQLIPTTNHTSTPVALAVTDLLPDTRYIFVVRARNSHGVSLPSPTTITIKTLKKGDKQPLSLVYKAQSQMSQTKLRLLEVEPVKESMLRLAWLLLSDADLIEGINIYYRLLDSPCTDSLRKLKMESVSLHSTYGPPPSSHIIKNLRPSSEYEVFIVPYFRTVEGKASASIQATTFDATRDRTLPLVLHHNLINSTSALISWNHLPEYINSHCIGQYNLLVMDIMSGTEIEYSASVSSTWLRVPDLQPASSYKLWLRGITNQSLRPLSEPLLITTNNVIVSSNPKPAMAPSLLNSPFLIIVIIVSSAALVFIALLCAVLYCIYRRRQDKRLMYKRDLANDGASHYYTKAGNKGMSSELPRSFSDRSMGITSTLYTNLGSHGDPMTKLYHQSPPNSPNMNLKTKPREGHYENPDRIRLMSQNKSSDKSYQPPEPYATTHLLGHPYLNCPPNQTQVPLNIPLSTHNSPLPLKSSGFGSYNNSLSESNGSQGSQKSKGSQKDKGAQSRLVFRFPPPPKMVSGDNPSDPSSRRHAKLFQQETSSMGSSSTAGSQRSATNCLINSKNHIMQNMESKESKTSKKDHMTCLTNQECCSQRLITKRLRLSPETSIMDDDSDDSHYSESSYNSYELTESQDDWPESACLSNESRRVRCCSTCSTEESGYAPTYDNLANKHNLYNKIPLLQKL